MTEFPRVLSDILKEKNIKGKELANATQISQSLISDYKNGKAEPTITNACKISKYLEISCDYLITGKIEKSITISKKEKELLKYFRNISEKEQDSIMNIIISLAKTESTGLSSESKII